MKRRLVQVALVALCLVVSALPAFGQAFTGRIDVTAKDSTGAVLPGVTVALTGTMTASSVTDARGEARFLNLAPGRYGVTAKLSGFNDYKNDVVPVGAGSVITLAVTMTVGGVATTVNVSADTPVIETKKQTVSTNVSLDELQNIPTSRDPWVVLQTVPGIIVDRVNVGGAESGQQSTYQAKGASGGDNTWNIDGIAITDMAALGASPTYYDFDMFQEMQVTTGGSDPSSPTGGVQLNFVLRSGTNMWRGSGRYYFENSDMQSSNVGTNVSGNLQSYNRTEYYKDYGAEGGGPLQKDKLWVWGAYGFTNPANEIYTYQNPLNPTAGSVSRTDPGCKGGATTYVVPLRTYQISARDCTDLKNTSLKASYAASNTLRASFTFFRGDKIKNGRGASATRPTPTTWLQKGPTSLYKGELNYTLSDRTFLTGRFAYTDGGFGFDPLGGYNTQLYFDDQGSAQNTYSFYKTQRPQQNAQIEGNHFRGSHEFKFGFGWRKSSVSSQSGVPGGVYTSHIGYPDMYTTIVRDWSAASNTSYWSAFVGDQISMDRLTLSAGVRWAREVANLEAASVPANPLSSLLPALTASAQSAVVTYNSITPRLGLTYALTESRKTIMRASYAMFASQLDSARGSVISSIPGYSYVFYYSRDLNGNRVTDPNELLAFDGTFGFDPNDPLGGNPDKIGAYKVPKTHEFVVGFEHEIMKNFGFSTNVTWRKYVDFNWTQFEGVRSDDYTQAGTVTGNISPVGPYNVPFYRVNAAAVPADRARIHEVRDGYSQRFWGVEVAATKRMSDNWMMRLGWSTSDHREYFDGPNAIGDPTPSPGSPNKNGGFVMRETTGSGKAAIYMVLPKYQYIMTAAYQMKFNILAGMNYLFRQGYAQPFFRSSVPGSSDGLGGSKTVLLIDDVSAYRLPNVHSLDARLSWMLKLNRSNIHFDLDFFNLMNTATVLGRAFNVSLAPPPNGTCPTVPTSGCAFNQIREIMNPRILRLGARITF